jgi:hypothetical protein
VAGDERLLISMFQDKPIAVLYRPSVPGTASPISLAAARIDQIMRLEDARVAIQRDTAHKSYSVEAAVPLKDLNLDPKVIDDLRGDAGVIFADETGKNRSLRLYYYNHDTGIVDDLATEATLQPNNWGTIAMPLGLNLLRDGSFEGSFVASAQDMDKGWYISQAINGMDAVMSPEAPYSGHQSLLLKASAPVKFPDEEYNNPDPSAFIKSANGGKGTGRIQVGQRVKVIPGHQYSMRYRYRSENYAPDRSAVGHPRGYNAFFGWIEWVCPPPSPNRGKITPVGDRYTTNLIDKSISDWFTVYDLQRFAPPGPYTAPEGAVAAVIVFDVRNAIDGPLPKFFFDNVEFVDVTPGAAQ